MVENRPVVNCERLEMANPADLDFMLANLEEN